MCTLRSILVLVVAVVAHDHCFAQKSLVALFRRVREMRRHLEAEGISVRLAVVLVGRGFIWEWIKKTADDAPGFEYFEPRHYESCYPCVRQEPTKKIRRHLPLEVRKSRDW